MRAHTTEPLLLVLCIKGGEQGLTLFEDTSCTILQYGHIDHKINCYNLLWSLRSDV